jgi:hypothetical protein
MCGQYVEFCMAKIMVHIDTAVFGAQAVISLSCVAARYIEVECRYDVKKGTEYAVSL